MSIKTLDRICFVALVIMLIVLLVGCVVRLEPDNAGLYPYDVAVLEKTERDFLAGFDDYVLYDSSVLTGDDIIDSGSLVIERCVGTVTDASTGDGRLLNPYDPEYAYINYTDCGFPLKDNTIVLTYIIYGPSACDVDDIFARYDFVLAG